MTRTKKIVTGIVALFLVLITVLVVIIATFDWNRLKPTINEKVSNALGRPFAINGDLSVQWAREQSEAGWRRWVPWPHVTANDIVLGNPEWARAPQFATLEKAYFSLSPVPLLAQRVVIRNIQLTKPWADLQRMKDGRANWTFAMESSGEPSPWLVDINAVGFDQGRVGFSDETLKADLEVLIDPLGKPIPYEEIVGADGTKAADGKSDNAPAAAKGDGKAADGKADTKSADSKSETKAADGKAETKSAQAKPADGKPATKSADGKTETASGNAPAASTASAQKTAAADKSPAADRPANDDAPRVAEPDRSQPVNDYVFGWKVSGKYNAQKLSGDGKIGGMLTLRDSRTPFPVQADIRVGATRAAIAGTITDPTNFGGLDLKLKLSGSNMADLYPLIGVTLPDTPPYSTDGHLVAELRRPEGALFEYRNFNGAVGKSDLHGDLSFNTAKPRPKLTGNLRSNQLRLEDLGPLVGVQSGGAEPPGDGNRKQPSAKALPISEFRTDRWNVMDANVKLTAKRIVHSAKLPLSDLNAHAIMDNGKLTLDPLRFGMAGGSIASTISLNGATTPMQGRAKISARQLRLKQLFADASVMQKSLGQLNGDIALAGVGNSVSALMGTANGEVKMLVNDGVISRSLMEIAGLNVGNYVISKLFGDDEVQINCGAADLDIRNGLMRTNAFLFDTENALVSIDGTANFKNEALDLDITPKSKGVRIFSLRSPLYVKGTFKNPDAGVQVLPLAARGAGMVALGALLTPIAGVLALVAPSAGDDDNQCKTMLQQLKQQPVKATAPRKGAR